MNYFTIHGARGSHPVSGGRYRRYGGHTSCFSLETPSGLLIIDAGSGLASLSNELAQRTTLPPITILFTHFHIDHLLGLTAFKPLLRKDAHITLMADASQARDWRRALTTITGKPFWPLGLLESGATIRLEDLPRRGRSEIMGPLQLYGIDISWCPVWHPQRCVSYRLTLGGQSIVLGTDREQGEAHLDPVFQAFCQGADVLIHDAQYTPEEHASRPGWGHSTWEEGARLAAAMQAQQLILTSHDPSRSDEEIDRLVEQAKRVFARTRAAKEEMIVGKSTEERAEAKPLEARTLYHIAVGSGARDDTPEDAPLVFRYTFKFNDGTTKVLTVQLHPKTLELIQPVRPSYPPWTALPHCKCTHCPLRDEEHPTCPAATSFVEIVEHFGRFISTETVHVTIESDARTYVKRAPLPEAISSLMGLLMVTSGCPVMAKLRPMVRHHLPFATLEETKYRVLSMYLMAQYFAEQHGRPPDWGMHELPKLYEEVHRVNMEFFKRLSEMNIEDASLNAIVRLDTMADSVSFTLDQPTLEEFEELFRPHFDSAIEGKSA
jgi:ribonuclease BN (tRNA processing enzyme)